MLSETPTRRRNHLLTRPAAAVPAAVAVAAVMLVAACGGSGSTGSSGGQTGAAAVTAALNQPATITFWTWAPDMQQLADQFMKLYPKIKVTVVDAGQSAVEYTKLETADKAGKGGPDVAQIEYFALPQFALSKQVVNLDEYGAQSLQAKYTTSAWEGVTVNGGVYGFPQDTGPMAMFYRADLYKKAGLTPPTTWAQFEADAVTIHKKLPGTYIADIDPTDAGGVDSMIWQAGGTPYQTSGLSDVTLNLQQSPVQQWASMWTSLLSRKLIATDPAWTTSWWQGMASGKYATWITGAWAPAPLEATIPQTAGDWRVTEMPQWTAGADVTADNGGSSTAVMSTSTHKAAAVAFAEWLDSSTAGAQALAGTGLFPATTALINSPAFLDAPVKILGGQEGNKILADSSAHVASGWQYLPFQVYANSVFADTVGSRSPRVPTS
jgi:multiple sugar transport system substrate-binding protein